MKSIYQNHYIYFIFSYKVIEMWYVLYLQNISVWTSHISSITSHMWVAATIVHSSGPELPQLCNQFSSFTKVWPFQNWFDEISSLIGQSFNNVPALYDFGNSLAQSPPIVVLSSVVYFAQFLESHLYMSTRVQPKTQETLCPDS